MICEFPGARKLIRRCLVPQAVLEALLYSCLAERALVTEAQRRGGKLGSAASHQPSHSGW